MATATRDADDPRPFFVMLARIIPPTFARLLQFWRGGRLSHARDKRNDSRSDRIVVGAPLAAGQTGQPLCRLATGPGDVGQWRAT
jgi:hypothetical protein